ncbi:DUF6461 domain-containing protein [Streptomyces atratus]|uniref:DUF6461 domain-containing protein n=1 Tax=Streptomyces atratus TaxID=1893 RepID=UPI00224FC7F8|nr:DUF6461 domain-containing protein [Streptomyces atratus]MCX5345859.1 DUF6461 domain-containing protein [Streptomyces atratus]
MPPTNSTTGTGARRTLVALTTIGSWTLVIEPNGFLGVTEEVALPTSKGTR